MNKYCILLTAFTLILSSCQYHNGRHVSGNGVKSTEQRNLTGFTGVETRGSIDIVVAQGNYNVKLEGDQNVLQYIETSIENERLVVRFRSGISLHDYDNATVYVTAPELSSFVVNGSGNIMGHGKISDKNKINIDVTASGDVELALDCPVINTETHGSGDITLQGESKNLSVEINGSGDVKASDLKAETVKVSTHGSGDADVFASESLDTEITGSGDIHYRGEPKITSSVHGSGEVSKRD